VATLFFFFGVAVGGILVSDAAVIDVAGWIAAGLVRRSAT
jgi:hypothetical protein